MDIKELKELGAVILLPDAEAYEKMLLSPKDVGYTRVYFHGIRVMFGNFDWEDYQKHLGNEKVFLDDTEVKKKV